MIQPFNNLVPLII